VGRPSDEQYDTGTPCTFVMTQCDLSHTNCVVSVLDLRKFRSVGGVKGTLKSQRGVQSKAAIKPQQESGDEVSKKLKHFDIHETPFCPQFAVTRICPEGSHVTPKLIFLVFSGGQPCLLGLV